jgi:cephalosporin hydroxylase
VRPRANVFLRRPGKVEKIIDRLRYRSWFSGMDFSYDWTSRHFTMWRQLLMPLRDEPLRLLEIGSWEGRSAVFFLNFFPRSTLICIDTFAGGDEHITTGFSVELSRIEQRFDHNLGRFRGRVEKIKSESAPAMARLAAECRRIDFAYIDGSHHRDDVMADSLGAWRLLEPGGVILWDDYNWGRERPPEERPQPAIDAFLEQHRGHYRLLAKAYQLAIERVD